MAAHTSPGHISQASVSIALARASSGWPVWGVIAALAAGIFVVVLVILAVAGRHPRNMIVRQHRPRLWVGRDERVKRAAAADVEALAGNPKLVRSRRPRSLRRRAGPR